MYIPADQNTIDQKIHKFMARKSPGRTLSMSVAERLAPVAGSAHKTSGGISYEQLEWHQSESSAHSTWQKAH